MTGWLWRNGALIEERCLDGVPVLASAIAYGHVVADELPLLPAAGGDRAPLGDLTTFIGGFGGLCRRLAFTIPWSGDDLMHGIDTVIAANRPEGPAALRILAANEDAGFVEPCSACVTIFPIKPEQAVTDRPLALSIFTDRRLSLAPDALAQRQFAGFHALARLARLSARRSRCDDAVLVDTNGGLAGCASGLVLLIGPGGVVTPLVEAVPQRMHLFHAIKDIGVYDLGWSWDEQAVQPQHLHGYSSALLISPSLTATPIGRIGPVQFADTGRAEAFRADLAAALHPRARLPGSRPKAQVSKGATPWT